MGKKRYDIWALLEKACKSKRDKKNSTPPTEAQLMQRHKFRVVAKFVKHAKNMIMHGYEVHKLKTMTPVNFLTKQILLSAVIGEYPDYRIDYSKVGLSSGKLDGVIVKEAVLLLNGNIKLSWEQYDSNQLPTRNDDAAFIFIYDSEKNQSFNFKYAAKRSDLSVELELLSSIHKKENLHCWLFFKAKEGHHASWCEYYTLTDEF